MRNIMFISIGCSLGTASVLFIGIAIYQFVVNQKYKLNAILFDSEEDELPFEPKEEPIHMKMAISRLLAKFFKNLMFSFMLVLTFLAWMDIVLYINKEFSLNILWLSEFYDSLMAVLKLSYNEIYKCFSYLHLFVGTVFMFEPLLETAYIKYELTKLMPKGRMMTGLECFILTNEIGDRFYSKPMSLLSKPRKAIRRTLFCLGSLLTLSWLALNIFLSIAR